ncbi:hypothetical protein ACHQM5_019692 [Ranunculus cassubicifolius]
MYNLKEGVSASVSPRRELQGPRPPVLKVGKDSFKIKKPKTQASHHPQPPRPPVVIHLKSPEIIHIKPEEFMGLVQELTGKPKSFKCSTTGSASRMEMKGSTNFSKDHGNNFEEKEDGMSNKASCGTSPSRVQSSLSPMFRGLFVPSPNVYPSLLDFGPIY